MMTDARILIAEDSPTQTAALRFILEQRGFSVAAASNGREALERLGEVEPTLVITDVVMPEMNGYELCQAIKSDERWQHIPVLLVTTLSDPEDVIRGLECGADNFIRKPYDAAYLLSRIDYTLMNLSLRKNQRLQLGIEITLGGQRYFITSQRQQILDLLISTYEQGIELNHELQSRERQLMLLSRISQELNRAGSEDEAIRRVADGMLELPGVQQVSIETARGFSPASGIDANLTIPLTVDRDSLGNLHLTTSDETPREVLHNIANQLGETIARTRIHAQLEELVRARTEKLERQAAGAAAVAELGRIAQTATNLSDLFGHACQLLLSAVGAGRATLVEATEHGPVVRADFGYQDTAGQTITTSVNGFGELSVVRRHADFADSDSFVVRAIANLLGHSIARARSEESLRRANALAQLAGHIARLGAWEVQVPDLRITWSEQTRAICEVPSGFVPTLENFFLFFTAGCRERIRAAFIDCVRERLPFDLELQMETASGRHLWVRMIGEAETDDGGTVSRLHGAIQDISASKAAAEKLEESEQRYLLIFDRNPHPLWVYDQETLRFLAVNEMAIRQYGYTREEFLAMTIEDIRPSEDVDLLRKSLHERDETPEAQTFGTFRHRKKTGEIIEVEISSSEVTFQGRQAGLVLAVDVTRQRELEQHLLRAQRLDSIGMLAGGIAHDLNNLLMPVMLGVSVVKQTNPEPKVARALENIEKSARRGKDLVSRILSFARGVKPATKQVDVAEALREIRSIIESTFPRNIALQFESPAGATLISADLTQLNQILLNLCVNARDAMPHGGRLLVAASVVDVDDHYARMHRGITPGRFAMIEVSDTGMGIPAHLVNRVFEPFFTTKELENGTGLGLSTVQTIVRSHGGHVTVYSEPGKGTTFRVYLPLEREASAADPRTPHLQLPHGQGQTILVADDEASVLEITRQTLETFGYKVLTAANGQQALTVFSLHREEIAAVVTDIMMPILDGTAVVDVLLNENPEVKIIASSGLYDGGTRMQDHPNVTAYLRKPYSADTLLSTLQRVLSQSR